MPKLDARDVLAVIALAIFGAALWIDHLGYLAEWAKQAVGNIPTVVLGYYFVDSFRRVQGASAPKPSDAPAAPEAQPGA